MMGGGPVDLGSGHDGAALEGDVGDLLVAGVGEVEEAHVWAQETSVADEGQVEECVGGLGGALDDGELGGSGDLAELFSGQDA